VESHFCAKSAQKWGTLQSGTTKQSQTTMGDMTVESHPCAKDAQGWGTRLLFCESTKTRSLETPLLLQTLGEED
jgi:hypothetical protein